jgi:nucleoside-diphosphate-sugar epimerase
MYKTVLITGAAGLIGKALTKMLLESGYSVKCFDLNEQFDRNSEYFKDLPNRDRMSIFCGSVLDVNSLRKAIDGCDVVVHLAAMLGVMKTEKDKLGCINVNIAGTDNVINTSVMHNVKKFIFASSSEVYGEPDSNPISEEQTTKGKTVYAVTKMAGEELLKGYNQYYKGLNFTIIRFFNTYGEGQVAQFVLTKWVRNVLNGNNPIVYGDGSQVRSYGHVEDAVTGVKLIIENSISNGKVYNLGNSSQVRTLVELAQEVIDVVSPDKGLNVEILGGFDGSDRDESREINVRYCDTSLAAKELGYNPKITTKEGILRIAKQSNIYNDWPSI